MPILSGDVKLLESAVMADVPEGGGAPTGNVIDDGVSNAIFPDISELDRAGGRVNLRKTFASIQTDDRDSYFGANVIVAEPPSDPRVSVTLFSTESTFDTRTEAASRIESYLNIGAEYAGFLFENHISGQRVIQLFQRPDAPPPNIGQTIVLVQDEGTGSEKSQYLRATSVSVTVRAFFDPVTALDYNAAVVTMETSDALRYDFRGSPAARSFTRASNGTKVRETVVADAGTYAGVSPLTATADLGDFTITAESIYTQLVPSAQTETPIVDIKSNGLSAAIVPTGSPITQSLSLTFTTTQSMHVGGPIYPATLSIVRSGITITDAGGVLVSGGIEVGTVDYDNGICTLLTNVFGTSGGTHTVTFTPGAVPDLITEQRSIPITSESRSLSYVFTLDDVPVAGSLSVSYLAQGRWYVLKDNGAGVLKGSSSSFGTGTLSYTTGSVAVTLGALPDVGSALVIQSYSKATLVGSSNTTLNNDGKMYVPINSDGDVSEDPGAKPFKAGTVVVTWVVSSVTKTATDDGAGGFTGDATGTIDYANGVARVSPTLLPAAGTVFTLSTQQPSSLSSATGVTLSGGSLGATGINPGSVSFSMLATFNYTSTLLPTYYRVSFDQRQATVQFMDDGAGNIVYKDGTAIASCGTINYATGVISFTTPVLLDEDPAGPVVYSLWGSYPWNGIASSSGSRTMTLASSANISFSSSGLASDTKTPTVNTFFASTLMVEDYVLKGVGFTLDTTVYRQLVDGTLIKNTDPTTGGGTPAGSVSGALGRVTVSSWTAGVSSTIGTWRGVVAPPTVGVATPFAGFSSTFRTAASPIRPGSFSVLGTMLDGTTFNVTAGTDGEIDETRVKGRINYEFGLVELYFTDPAATDVPTIDLTFLGISGVGVVPTDLVMTNSIRYNAVSYSYLPLDADILGIDPVRLPSDGRVPIFRPGGFAVVGHTGEITATVSNGQTIDCARVRLSRVRVIGDDGVVINTGYTADLEAGEVTFTDVTGYSQPVTVQHRIEDMAIVREAQINGEISFTRALSHDYPMGSFVSSALVAGDLFSRVSKVFDQVTWTGVWSDSVIGSAATATFNNTAYPIEVTNRGALTERWAIQFTNTTSFNVIGENVGVIASGTTSVDCSPVNPSTGVPYFTIPALGWGAGWSTGNVLRINTIGSEFPVWVVRTIQQGPETVPDDSFVLLIRGDVNA